MKSVFPGLIVTDLKEPKDLFQTLLTSISTTLSSNANSAMSERELDRRDFILKTEALAVHYRLPKMPTSIDKEYWVKFGTNVKENKEKTSLNIENKLLGEGTFSFAFKAYDTKKKQYLVIKIPKNKSKDYMEDRKQETEKRVKTSLYTCQMTRLFRTACVDIPQAPPIFFLQPILYKLDTPFQGETYVYAEPYLDLNNQEWQKYSNNSAYCSDQSFASFSHFTYIMSGGLFLVSDL